MFYFFSFYIVNLPFFILYIIRSVFENKQLTNFNVALMALHIHSFFIRNLTTPDDLKSFFTFRQFLIKSVSYRVLICCENKKLGAKNAGEDPMSFLFFRLYLKNECIRRGTYAGKVPLSMSRKYVPIL